MPTPSPTPHNPTTTSPTDIFGSVLHGLWHGVTASPVTVVMFGFVAAILLTEFVRNVIWFGTPNDALRLFSSADKRRILARAGYRCEHHGWITGRCRETEKLQADHVHPHSRGGQTAIANGQALCARHNRAKSARIPFNFQLRALEKRRAGYFPPDEPALVARRQRRQVARART
jgi:Restriction endonuclease